MTSQPESAQSGKGSVSEGGMGHGAVESVTSPVNKSNVGVDMQGAALADDPGMGATGDSWRRVTERERGGGGEEAAAFPRAKPKKTRGRVKIDIDFIEDRFRRRTTFSKRKKYIIKKAKELATLTGTQVLVLAHSETGRVHEWSTPMFQPIIKSKDGKALIQTCLEKGRPADPSESPTAGSKDPDIAFQLSETEDLQGHSEDAHLQPQNVMPPSTPYLEQPLPIISRRQLQMALHSMQGAGQPTFYWKQ